MLHDHEHENPAEGEGALPHGHAPANFGTAFAVGVGLNAAFVVAEAIGGLFAHSLALLADAGHNLGDVFGLLLAWGAAIWSRQPPTPRHTYGWSRSSILAALANASLLLVSVGVIGWEAVQRLRAPAAVAAGAVIWIAAAGIGVNAITALLFRFGRKADLNLRAAFVHMAADAAISAGVVLAGIVILFTRWLWLDPAVSLVLAGAIVAGTWGLLRDATDLALDAVPKGVDLPAVRRYLAALPDVVDVHHLHVWALGTRQTALTAHLVLGRETTDNELLCEISEELARRFHIGHPTIQFESPGRPPCADRGCGGREPAGGRRPR